MPRSTACARRAHRRGGGRGVFVFGCYLGEVMCVVFADAGPRRRAPPFVSCHPGDGGRAPRGLAWDAIARPTRLELGDAEYLPGFYAGRPPPRWAPSLAMSEDSRTIDRAADHGELDLHAFAARDIPLVVEEYVRVCRERGILRLRLVHGPGRGVQRAGGPPSPRASSRASPAFGDAPRTRVAGGRPRCSWSLSDANHSWPIAQDVFWRAAGTALPARLSEDEVPCARADARIFDLDKGWSPAARLLLRSSDAPEIENEQPRRRAPKVSMQHLTSILRRTGASTDTAC